MFKKKKKNILQNNKLFQNLSVSSLNFEFNPKEVIEKQEGDIIFQPGAKNDYLYLIIEGTVKLKYLNYDNAPIIINKTKDDFFGEFDLFDQKERISSAVAETGCLFYPIKKTTLNSWLKKNKKISINLGLTEEDEEKEIIEEATGDIEQQSEPDSTIENYQSDKPEEELFPDEEDFTEKTEEAYDAEPEKEFELPQQSVPTESENPSEEVESHENIDENKIESDEMLQEETPEDFEEIITAKAFTEEVKNIQSEPDKFAPEKEDIIEHISKTEEIAADAKEEGIHLDIEPAKEDKAETEFEEEPAKDVREAMKSTTEKFTFFKKAANLFSHTKGDDKKNKEEIKKEPETKPAEKNKLQETTEIIEQKKDVAAEDILNDNPESKIPEEEKPKQEKPEIVIEKSNFGQLTESIIQAITEIAGANNQNELVERLTYNLKNIIKSERVLYYSYDEDSSSLSINLASESDSKKLTYDLGEDIIGQSAQYLTIISRVAENSPTPINPKYDTEAEYETHSVLCAPLVYNSNILGVVQLLNSEKGEFDTEDEDVAKWITGASAVILKKIKDFQEELEKLKLKINQTQVEPVSEISAPATETKDSSIEQIASFLLDDIKLPVSSIKQYVEFLRNKEHDEEIKPALEVLKDQAQSVLDLLQTTLEYSKSNIQPEFITYKLSDVLKYSLGLLAEYLEFRKIKLFKKIEADCELPNDEKLFYQAFFQLTKIACDFNLGSDKLYVIAKKQNNKAVIELLNAAFMSAPSDKEESDPVIVNSLKDKLGYLIADEIFSKLRFSLNLWANSDGKIKFTISSLN